jgi:U3 small nucleolar RNA-associated protein 19
MPYLEMSTKAGTKRKRPEQKHTKPSKTRRAEESGSDEEPSLEEQVLELEAQVLESRKHYNNIPKLLSLASEDGKITSETVFPAVALCRIYCRLFAHGTLKKDSSTNDSEAVIVKWLRARLDEYAALLCDTVRDGSEDVQSTALTLAMRLVKEEINHDGHAQWQTGIFPHLVSSILSSSNSISTDFLAKFFTEYDDVCVFTLQHLADSLKSNPSEEIVDTALEILGELDLPTTEEDPDLTFYAPQAEKDVRPLLLARRKRKAVQQAWMAVLRSPLSKAQNKHILSVLVDKIVPWFNKVELLMDYLTDSYDVGGATSLLALSGLFHLMTERNLDYPSFYEKLYSLLDDDLLHSKHRSRFFRLLDIFMSSTHLPAALVASFIKRLSRLALHAPPAGIVVVVPWIYNMFKLHPQCTFMIHRTQYPISSSEVYTDAFDPKEQDPMNTQAIDSSIWEIETLQNHWHPNVATLAKIISEQFHKSNYNLEDFLDHSYATLIEAEVGREMKKVPVVEWDIPKHIFLEEDGRGANEFGELMGRLLAA